MQTLCSCSYFINKRQCKLAKQLSEGLKIPVYWNKYKVIDNKVLAITDPNAEKTHDRIGWFKLWRI